jgi:CHRD domain-containing protein
MHSTILRSAMATLACATALVIASPSLSFAEMITLKADLKASNEVPPNDSKGTGTITATYDTASKKLSWTGNYAGLSGPATAGHFHGATPPSPPAGNSTVAVPTPATSSPFEGSAILTDDQAADLLAGRWYHNIHTAAHPGGEIRGQVTK